MNIRKLLFASAIALGCIAASAQEAEETTVYTFMPHFYGQVQIGGQETLGEGSFGKLFSPNAQIAAGYQFSPLLGLRFGLNSWQSKGYMEFTPADKTTAAAQSLINAYGDNYNWKWNYIAPALDLTLDLTNTIWGYNPERKIDWNIFAGIGLNIAWNNKDAVGYNAALKGVLGQNGLEHVWEGTKTRFMGRFGTMVDYRVSPKVSVGIELQANLVNDHYNSKKAPNADWYFNGLVGVKYTFGPTHSKKVVRNEPVIVERVVERVVEVPVEVVREVVKEVPAAPAVEPYKCDIFFKINSRTVSKQEMQKVDALAEYMKANPKSKVTLSGYADIGTGTPAINIRLAKQRAEAVCNALVKKGISADRITTESMTSAEHQPFAENDKNRVVICIAE